MLGFSSHTLMVQGTTSDAGKSLLVTALCRLLAREEHKVAPFKPQNMALNSAVTAEGGEIGRAQAVQALAAGVPPHVDFNPVLLKPNSDTGCQVIIHGKALSNMEAEAYHDYKRVAMQAVLDSYQRLQAAYPRIVVEGAGSPAEINLRAGDIANMGFAEAVDCPVILVADIDRGGVFAHLVGTLALLSPSEQARIKGFVINKFRGEYALLEPGVRWLEEYTGKPVLGVLPYLQGLDIAAEDAIMTQQQKQQVRLKVVVPVLPRISNHTDFDALRLHPQLDLAFVPLSEPLPPCDLLILPGSKSVRDDLAALQAAGWEQQIQRHLRYGGKLLGICGGYQMLGHRIDDLLGLEGVAGSSRGLGQLPVATELKQDKQLIQTQGVLNLTGTEVRISGYEIHHGQSQILPEGVEETGAGRPFWMRSNGTPDGWISNDGQVAGCYLHGLFDDNIALQAIISWAGATLDRQPDYASLQLAAIDRLADAVATHLDMAAIAQLLSPQWREFNG